MGPRSLLPIFAVLTWSVTATAQEPEQPGDPARGRELSVSLCSGCHQVSPEHQGPVNDTAPSFMALAREADDTYMRLIAMFEPGHADHPVLPTPPLDRQQMRDVVAYIRSVGED